MIITCESCKTKFQLDPRLIKGLSSKVRCSQCKHVFFVSREDHLAIDQVILEPELPDSEIPAEARPPHFIPSQAPVQPPAKKLSMARLLLLLGLLVMVSIGAGIYWLVASSSKSSSQQVAGPGNTKKVLPHKSEKAAVTILESMQPYFLENDHLGQIFVVEGEVRNDSPSPVSFILVEGKLYTIDSKVSQNQKAYCGNVMSREQLSKLAVGELQNRMMNREGKDQMNVQIASKAKVAFQVVFHNLPSLNQLGDYSVEVVGSEVVNSR
jgi:predicted Zn finger-like uncharacterized protein